ncbi:MAG: hypothetical protein ACPGRE_01735 [Flavobacteriaceae bacterium]
MRDCKIHVLLFLCLSSWGVTLAQNENSLVDIRLKDGDSLIKGAVVRNKTQSKNFISDENGLYQIQAQLGDSIIVSHISYKALHPLIVNQEIISQGSFKVDLTGQYDTLDEVFLFGNENVNSISLGLIDEFPMALSPNERRLRMAGDFKAIHLLGILGGGINVEALLNKLNGRTKRLKKLVALEQETKVYDQIFMAYSDYIVQVLKVKKEHLGQFIYFLVSKPDFVKLLSKGESSATVQLYMFEYADEFNKGMEKT